MKKKKVAFYTLGCKVNQNETEALTALFVEQDTKLWNLSAADVYIIKTYVTHMAIQSRQLIGGPPGEIPQQRSWSWDVMHRLLHRKSSGFPG